MNPTTLAALTGLLGLAGKAGDAFLGSENENRAARAQAQEFADTMDLKNRELGENTREFDATNKLAQTNAPYSQTQALMGIRNMIGAPKPYDFLSALSARYAGG